MSASNALPRLVVFGEALTDFVRSGDNGWSSVAGGSCWNVARVASTLGIDAVTYPTGNIPPAIIKAPVEPDKNDRSHQAWTLLGTMGFPAITVPAGFTTQVFDRVRDPSVPGGARLVGPIPAEVPVGIDFLGMPFGEPTILKIASAYEAATKHRRPPPGFGPLGG